MTDYTPTIILAVAVSLMGIAIIILTLRVNKIEKQFGTDVIIHMKAEDTK